MIKILGDKTFFVGVVYVFNILKMFFLYQTYEFSVAWIVDFQIVSLIRKNVVISQRKLHVVERKVLLWLNNMEMVIWQYVMNFVFYLFRILIYQSLILTVKFLNKLDSRSFVSRWQLFEWINKVILSIEKECKLTNKLEEL